MLTDQDPPAERIMEMLMLNAFKLRDGADIDMVEIATAHLIAGFGLLTREVGTLSACDALDAMSQGGRAGVVHLPRRR